MALGDEPVASTQAGEPVVPVDEPKRPCLHRLTLDAPATGPGSPCGARPGAHFVRMGGAPVGRPRERAELGRALDDLAAGTGTFVLITGEAGIGKSTLLAGLTARAADTAVPVLLGRCVPDRGVPEFWTWARLLAAPAAATLGLHPSLVDLDAADAPATARFRTVVRCARPRAAPAATGGLGALRLADRGGGGRGAGGPRRRPRRARRRLRGRALGRRGIARAAGPPGPGGGRVPDAGRRHLP